MTATGSVPDPSPGPALVLSDDEWRRRLDPQNSRIDLNRLRPGVLRCLNFFSRKAPFGSDQNHNTGCGRLRS